ncbi:MAG: hypothetical protein P9M11_01770 [Candidatus Tenebribacter burtonii]|nr:hypothetical protein [Candidatus Tenebribacter burtonii]
MKDFTLNIYKQLLQILISKNYIFFTVEEYFKLYVSKSPNRPFILMRHDVDRKPNNSLRMAKLENELGVKATYYFRTIPKTFKPEIIKEIAELGHEIGYHYENLCEIGDKVKGKSEKEIYKLALEDFIENLAILRQIVPIKNIAMHGRPTSKWDSRLLWNKYNYKKYGILSEPYFDIDFNKVFYITDAGRSWNNERVNLRDKVESKFNFTFNHTENIIQALNQDKLPNKIMINIHPEHWADSQTEWYKIWVIRKAKNTVKKLIIRNKI